MNSYEETKKDFDSIIIDHFSKPNKPYSDFEREVNDIKISFYSIRNNNFSLRDNDPNGLMQSLFGETKYENERNKIVYRLLHTDISTDISNIYYLLRLYVVKTGVNYICNSLSDGGLSEDQIVDSMSNYIATGNAESIPNINNSRTIAENLGNEPISKLISLSRVYNEDGMNIGNASVKAYVKTVVN